MKKLSSPRDEGSIAHARSRRCRAATPSRTSVTSTGPYRARSRNAETRSAWRDTLSRTRSMPCRPHEIQPDGQQRDAVDRSQALRDLVGQRPQPLTESPASRNAFTPGSSICSRARTAKGRVRESFLLKLSTLARRWAVTPSENGPKPFRVWRLRRSRAEGRRGSADAKVDVSTNGLRSQRRWRGLRGCPIRVRGRALSGTP